VDDDTWQGCADELTGLWAHTDEKVTSLRLFAAWKSQWDDSKGQREAAWEKLEQFMTVNDAKLLMGAQVTCNNTSDDIEWQWTLELMEKLGKDRIMGVAIGNEKDNDVMACQPDFWTTGYWTKFQARVADLDTNGYNDTKVTIVWSMSTLAGQVFKTAPENAMLMMSNAYKKYGDRWAWTFNPYAIWDPSMLPTSVQDCAAKCANAVALQTNMGVLATTRNKIKVITGNDNDTLWVGETGWSSPAPGALVRINAFCPDFFGVDTYKKWYEMFMSWDLEVPGVKGPDHAFYFTMRDSSNQGDAEYFGLVKACGDPNCKVNTSTSDTAFGFSEVVV